MVIKTFSSLFVFATLALSQPFSAGLKMGAPLTDALNVKSVATFASIATDNGRFMIGPFVELRLAGGFSIEVDALHRGFSYKLVTNPVSDVDSWEFPVVAKYKFWKGPVKPYVEGGLVFSHLSGVSNLQEVLHRSDYGIVIGAGVEIHALVLRISPEIRYDGFVFRNINSTGDVLQSNRNQAMFLVGIGF